MSSDALFTPVTVVAGEGGLGKSALTLFVLHTHFPERVASTVHVSPRGGDPFGEYQVPLAILALQQGLGRLIRHRQDRGVLAVLDPRLRTKGYGARFVASLPPAPVVHELSDVDAFFSV